MIEGGCHCGAIRYRISADRVTGGQCHCRACQRYSGGGPNLFALIEPDAFTYTKGTPKRFAHPDLPDAVTRSFCGNCGTLIATSRPDRPELVLRVGTLNDPSIFKGPRFAIFIEQGQSFHLIPEGMPTFETLPPSA